MVRGLIFDVDGTLVTLKVDRAKLHSATSRVLRDFGFDLSFMEEDKLTTQEVIEGAKRQVEEGGVDSSFEDFRASLNAALDSIEMEWNALAQPIAGAAEVLAKLKADGVKLATLTNSGRTPSDWLLKKHDLHRLFDFTLTRDDVPALKPRPDGIVMAMGMMGLPKREVFYVGDSVIDVQAARGAGVKVASVTTGRYTHERLMKEGTDFILSSVSELLDLVRSC